MPAEMDQKRITFVPHVQPIVKGTTVEFLNSDPFPHNVFWPDSQSGAYVRHNLGAWRKGDRRAYTFEEEGSVMVICAIHSEMEAHIVVLQNPF